MLFDHGIFLLLVLVIVFLILGRIEWIRHEMNIRSVPIRIVVNGTRGKSTVTRLVAAGLRAGGYKVMAKTTGTRPSMVFNNALEMPVIRPGRPNIREQLGIFSKAVKEGVNAVVLENMSLRPDLQWVEESRMIQPGVVVITNVRADHLDIMGPTLKDIARNFIHAVPRNTRVVTAEKELFSLMKELGRKRALELIQSQDGNIEESDMKKFSYLEHRENVALAVEVCRLFGIGKKEALDEMHKYVPDPGVLRSYELTLDDKKVLLVNALAANDPDSTFLIYDRLDRASRHFYVLVNCRSDRIDRSLQMAGLIHEKLHAELFFITGSNTRVLIRHARRLGMNMDRIVDLGDLGHGDVYDAVKERIKDRAMMMAIGNIVGYGEGLIKYFVMKGGA
jgi:poly-gamma-glutamate synthase PgsB/CapB